MYDNRYINIGLVCVVAKQDIDSDSLTYQHRGRVDRKTNQCNIRTFFVFDTTGSAHPSAIAAGDRAAFWLSAFTSVLCVDACVNTSFFCNCGIHSVVAVAGKA
jgi:hypothetical protein